MNFIVHFTLGSFFSTPPNPKSTVYVAVFALPGTKPSDSKGHLLITSDFGIEGGSSIHALRLTFLDEAEDSAQALKNSTQASKKLHELFKAMDVNVLEGVLSTAGLQESLAEWGHVARYTLADFGKIVEGIKERIVNEHRRRDEKNGKSAVVRGKGIGPTRKS